MQCRSNVTMTFLHSPCVPCVQPQAVPPGSSTRQPTAASPCRTFICGCNQAKCIRMIWWPPQRLVVRCLMTWVAHPLILWQLTRPSRCMQHDTTKLRVWNDSGQHHGWLFGHSLSQTPPPVNASKTIARFQSVVRADEWVGWVGWRHQVVQPQTLFHSWHAAGRTALKYATGDRGNGRAQRNESYEKLRRNLPQVVWKLVNRWQH